MKTIVKSGCQQPSVPVVDIPAYVGKTLVRVGNMRTSSIRQSAPITQEPAYLQCMRFKDPVL